MKDIDNCDEKDVRWQKHIEKIKQKPKWHESSDILYGGGLLGAFVAPALFHFFYNAPPEDLGSLEEVVAFLSTIPGAIFGIVIALLIRSLLALLESRKSNDR